MLKVTEDEFIELTSKHDFYGCMSKKYNIIDTLFRTYMVGLTKTFKKSKANKVLDIKLDFNETDRFYLGYDPVKCTIMINRGVLKQIFELYSQIEVDDNTKFFLSVYSIFFLISHEVAHASYAHNMARYKGIDANVLEYDADCFAVTKLFEYTKYAVRTNYFKIEKPDRLWSILHYTIIGVFYLRKCDDDFKDISKRTHPPAGIRKIYCIETLNDFYVHYSIKICKFDLEKQLNQIYSIPQDIYDAYENNCIANMNYLSDLVNKWKSSAKTISKNSHLPIEGVDYKKYFDEV